MGDVGQPVQQLGWQAAMLTSALQAMGDVDQPDQQLGWQAALLTSPAERIPRSDPANDRAKVTALLWYYQQLSASLGAQVEADPADEVLASELSYVNKQVSEKENKLRTMKSLSELINAKVCFIDEQKTAIREATTHIQMWQEEGQEASRKLEIAISELHGLRQNQASAQQQELQAQREIVANFETTSRARMCHIVQDLPRIGAVTPQPQDVVTSAQKAMILQPLQSTGAGISCGGPESTAVSAAITAFLPTEPISEQEMYIGSTDSDIPQMCSRATSRQMRSSSIFQGHGATMTPITPGACL